MSEKKKETRNLKKVGSKYVLTIVSEQNNRTTTEEYSEHEMRDIHDSLSKQKVMTRKRIADIKKEIDVMNIDDADEVRAFKLMMDKANNLVLYDQKKDELKYTEEFLTTLEEQSKEIEITVPVVLRNKK